MSNNHLLGQCQKCAQAECKQRWCFIPSKQKLSAALKQTKFRQECNWLRQHQRCFLPGRPRSNEFCNCQVCSHVARMRNHLVTFEAYQSRARRLGKRTHTAKMNPKRKLEREAHQLSESIQATCQMLDSRTLTDANRKRLRSEVDRRTAARKSILKHLWVSPRTGVGERP
jgi:hypothetical protein